MKNDNQMWIRNCTCHVLKYIVKEKKITRHRAETKLFMLFFSTPQKNVNEESISFSGNLPYSVFFLFRVLYVPLTS